MWFGDLVTMRWWDDLWLNESFAEYLGHRVSGEHTWVEFGIDRKSWGHRADRRPSTHPVAGNGAADAAERADRLRRHLLRQGRLGACASWPSTLGDDVFLDGLRRYIAAHADGNAEFADLTAAWTQAGASELDAWTQAWLRTTGVDELTVRDGAVLRRSCAGTPARTRSPSPRSPPTARRSPRRPSTSPRPRPRSTCRPATLVLPDARDETWAKLVLCRRDLGGHAGRARRARRRPRRASRSGTRCGWPSPTPSSTRARGRRRHRGAAGRDRGRRCSPSSAAGRCASWPAAACRRRPAPRRCCEPGCRAAQRSPTWPPRLGPPTGRGADAVSASSDVARLQAWLAGTRPAGRSDAGHRAALGRADRAWRSSVSSAPAEIDAAAAHDHSSQGAVHAARCRAARPDAAAKAAAWQAIVADAAAPELRAVRDGRGVLEPGQRDLTAPLRRAVRGRDRRTAGVRVGLGGRPAGRCWPTRGARSAAARSTRPSGCWPTRPSTPASAARSWTPATTCAAPWPSASASVPPAPAR